MRLALLLAAVALAGVSPRRRTRTRARSRRSDRALLARPATYEEQIARAGRAPADRAHASRSLRLARDVRSARARRHAASRAAGSFDYFLMRPAECTYLAWFRQAPARWDPRTLRRRATARASATSRWRSPSSRTSRTTCSATRTRRRSSATACSRSGSSRTSSARSVAESQALATLYATRMYPAAPHADARVLVGRVPRRRQVRPAPLARPLAELAPRRRRSRAARRPRRTARPRTRERSSVGSRPTTSSARCSPTAGACWKPWPEKPVA